MPEPPPFVDIHCHLLPGLDDGAADWNESLAMARLAVADGISAVVATPHQLGAHAATQADAIRARTRQLQQLLDHHRIALQVLPGADVRIEPDMVGKLRNGRILTLADRRRHVLLELPHDLYLPLERLLAGLGTAGIVGILSHPERNLGILANGDLLYPLVRAGCLLQVTAGALVGTFGPRIMEFSQSLVRRRLVHFVATDAHGAKARRPLLRRAFQRVAALAGYQTAVDLCCRNPARVLAGQTVTLPQPSPRESRITAWLRHRKAG
jgi:protein-tyrosine phosphatase